MAFSSRDKVWNIPWACFLRCALTNWTPGRGYLPSLSNPSKIKCLQCIFQCICRRLFRIIVYYIYVEILLDVNIELHRRDKYFPVVERDILLVLTDDKQGQETRYVCYFWMLERFDFLPDKLHTICWRRLV